MLLEEEAVQYVYHRSVVVWHE